ncbi:MAG: hypothetical protein JWQ88_2656, partial [Rhodoferax sp.]|nr:hypothetical protein [Rhodoferax sp.]
MDARLVLYPPVAGLGNGTVKWPLAPLT